MFEHTGLQGSYGSDRARLVYGERSDGTLAHISEVQRGLACECVCPACRGRLVARLKDDHQIPHFAHHSGHACGSGPETVLHLLAKEAFRDSPKVVLPERLALKDRIEVFSIPEREVETSFLRLEFGDHGSVIPDLYVSVLGHDLFIEVAVTHFVDAEKVDRLRLLGIPALEIDLSRLPRDASREAIADAVLRSAPRSWVYHPNIDAARERQQAEDKERKDRIQADHDKRVEEVVRAYRNARAHPRADGVPRLEELAGIGLSAHVGFPVAGHMCFAVHAAVWQTLILAEVFHDRCLGKAVCNAVAITQHLHKAGLVRPPFLRVPGSVAAGASAIEPTFAPPWRAVDSFLDRLVGQGVMTKAAGGKMLAPRFAEAWRIQTQAETEKKSSFDAALMAVDTVLAALPARERGTLTCATWLETKHHESGLMYGAALQSEIEAPKIIAEIDAVVRMMDGRGPIPYGTAGLPIEAAVERHRALLARQSEEQKAKRLLEADRQRQSRRDRLCIDAEQRLSGQELGDFLNSRSDALDGMTPLEAAEDSEAGLTRARNYLAGRLQQKDSDAEAAAEAGRYRAMIVAEAERRLPNGQSGQFLNARDDDLDRKSPLAFVKDKQSYRKALVKLGEWERAFGRSG